MGQRYDAISDTHRTFIEQQKLFFVGTADVDGRVNISPKGMDSLRVLGPNRVIWLNVTGSGNETAAHVEAVPRMTIMFAAFEGAPNIMRLYGTPRAVHRNDADWAELTALLPDIPGARQVFDLHVDLVQTSCGMAVPLYEYKADRELLRKWATRQGPEGLDAYREQKNQHTLDGKPTGILAKTT